MPGCSAGNRASRKGRENFSARVPYALRPSPYLRDAEPRQWGDIKTVSVLLGHESTDTRSTRMPTTCSRPASAGHSLYEFPQILRYCRLMEYSSGLFWKANQLGYNPLCLCGCSSMVELQPSKLITRVRFPSPAPETPRPRHYDGAVFFSGAPSRNRTYNLRIRSPLLYPLSHGRLTFAGVARPQAIIAHLLAQQTSKTNPRPQRSKAPLFAGAALPYPHVSRM